MFLFENQIVPSVFSHRKAYWDFLNKLFGSSLTKFVEETDQYWLDCESYYSRAYTTSWEDGMLKPDSVMICLQGMECLQIPYICFALKVDNWELQLQKATPKLLEITQQIADQQNSQKLKSIDQLKYEAMKSIHQKHLLAKKASQLMMSIGQKLCKTPMAGSVPYQRAEHIYKLIKNQTATMSQLCNNFRQKTTIELGQNYTAVTMQTSRIIGSHTTTM